MFRDESRLACRGFIFVSPGHVLRCGVEEVIERSTERLIKLFRRNLFRIDADRHSSEYLAGLVARVSEAHRIEVGESDSARSGLPTISNYVAPSDLGTSGSVGGASQSETRHNRVPVVLQLPRICWCIHFL